MSTPGIIDAPGMLIIGSAGRNSGKTEFATRLIAKFADSPGIIAAKATAVDRTDGSCPRGGSGCGVCSSLNEDFLITEECDIEGDKDTCRLLAAGAERVYWLRVLKSKMKKGFTQLQNSIEPGVAWICETNSLRHAVRPDLFLMVMNNEKQEIKKSASEVIEHTDAIITSDPANSSFDLDMSRLSINNGRWAMKSDATAIILAGGRSKRMQTDKAMLPVGGVPMIRRIAHTLAPHFDDTLLSVRAASDYTDFDMATVPDIEPDKGPLMGIASALAASKSEINFVTACDIPEIDIPTVRLMLREIKGYDVVVPRISESRLQPLFAVYRRSISAKARQLVNDGARKIRELFDHCRVKYIDCPLAVEQMNLNTREDYEAYIRGGENK